MPKESVFISYAREDAAFVRRLRSRLNELSIQSWHDVTNIRPATVWKDEIEGALKRATDLIVVFSPAARRSRWVKAEWTTALTRGIRVIPLLIKGAKLPPELRHIQAITWKQPRKPWLRLIDTLIDAPTRGPQLVAEFDVDDDGDPHEAEGDAIFFELRIEQAPPSATRVRYEFHHTSFDPRVFYVRNARTQFALEECTSYGDFLITATVETPRGTREIRSTLWAALRRMHGTDTKRSIIQALSRIRLN